MKNASIQPVGLRQAIAKTFLDALATDLAQNCGKVIKRVRAKKPYDYFRIVVSLLPKEVPVADSSLEDMTDEELADILDAVRSLIAARLAAASGEGDGEANNDRTPRPGSGILCDAAPENQDQERDD